MSKINSLILIAVLAIALSSCDKKDKNLLNTWRIENVKFSRPIPPQYMAQITQQIEMMKSLTRITYKVDGTTEEVQPDKTHKGQWEMSKNGSYIYATNEMGVTDRYVIIELTKDKFTYLMPSRNGDTLTFFYVPFSAKDTVGKKMQMPQQQPAQQQSQGNQPEAGAPQGGGDQAAPQEQSAPANKPNGSK